MEEGKLSDRDAFGLVLLLLRLEGELDEELLQLLVTVVDAKLLKAATHNKKMIRWILLAVTDVLQMKFQFFLKYIAS